MSTAGARQMYSPSRSCWISQVPLSRSARPLASVSMSRLLQKVFGQRTRPRPSSRRFVRIVRWGTSGPRFAIWDISSVRARRPPHGLRPTRRAPSTPSRRTSKSTGVCWSSWAGGRGDCKQPPRIELRYMSGGANLDRTGRVQIQRDRLGRGGLSSGQILIPSDDEMGPLPAEPGDRSPRISVRGRPAPPFDPSMPPHNQGSPANTPHRAAMPSFQGA